MATTNKAEASTKTVKLRFNLDTVLSTGTTIHNIHGRDVVVQDFEKTVIAKKGEVHEVEESVAKKLMSEEFGDGFFLPVGNGKPLQRTTLDDFIEDKFVSRVEVVH